MDTSPLCSWQMLILFPQLQHKPASDQPLGMICPLEVHYLGKIHTFLNLQ